MRAFAYAAAILAAVGIMYFIATAPQQTDEPTAVSSDVAASAIDETADVELASLTLNVPEMHCPVMCYPNVKKTLEGRGDVASVELVPQKEEGVIDKPQVVVKYKDGFNVDDAIVMLEKKGFGGSTVIDE
jgi:hypothetical protein